MLPRSAGPWPGPGPSSFHAALARSGVKPRGDKIHTRARQKRVSGAILWPQFRAQNSGTKKGPRGEKVIGRGPGIWARNWGHQMAPESRFWQALVRFCHPAVSLLSAPRRRQAGTGPGRAGPDPGPGRKGRGSHSATKPGARSTDGGPKSGQKLEPTKALSQQ